MIRVGITGADGFIGLQLRYFLYARRDVETIPAGRETFSSPDRLARFAASADAVVHLAGLNRGEEKEVAATNIDLCRRLIAACRAASARPRIIFASSTHIYRETPYGEAKRVCAEEFHRWSQSGGGPFFNLVLPHVFGEGQRPYYNSVTATFCRRLAGAEELEVNPAGELELLHAQRVAARIAAAIAKGESGEETVAGTRLTVGELADRLREIDRSYRVQIIPDLADPLGRELFNTYRSYLFPGHYPVALPVREDGRGHLFETVKSASGGQSFFSLTRPGVTRGNHYHTRKMERFLVLQGEAEIRVRRLFDDRVESFPVAGRHPAYVDIPTFHTHTITNTGGGDLLTLFWTSELFNPADPDTYPEEVS